MLKELSVKEALQLLAEKYPEPVEGVAWSIGMKDKIKAQLFGTHGGNSSNPFSTYKGCFEHFAIEVPDEYRYMTEEEQAAWVITTGYKHNLMRWKGETKWMLPVQLDADEIKMCEYCTVEIIDGKIVYSEPMEFKVKVE